jgi:internalin A
VTNYGIKDLVSLTWLDIRSNRTFTDQGIRGLTNLTYLDVAHSDTITPEAISGMTRLKTLRVEWNDNFQYYEQYTSISLLANRLPNLAVISGH